MNAPISQDDWKNAMEMHLRCEPFSARALDLVERVMAQLAFPTTDKPARRSTWDRRRKALGALLADLMKAEADGQAGSHGMKRDEFPAKVLGFGYDIFQPLKDAMVSAGLLSFEPGKPRWETVQPYYGGEGVIKNAGGWVARFKLTRDAMTLAEEAGVQVDAWKDHWRRFAAVQDLAIPEVPTAALIELRSASERDGRTKRKGTAMPVDLSQPVVQNFLADLEDHNAFLHSVGVEGVDFVGLRRVFNGGDREGFNWRTGGRFYSIRYKGMEAAYEGMSGDDRRHNIRLGGEPVGEADMSASQLRLLYALLDTPVPATLAVDPYCLPGLPRDPVKLVVAQALGKGRPRSRTWGRNAVKEYAKEHPGRSLTKDHRFRAYESAVLAAHPILERLEDPDVPRALELQFVESEIVRKAMASLRREGIPSLPVHDSLVVPRGNLEEAGEALKDAFRSVVELVLGYTTEYSAAVSFK